MTLPERLKQLREENNLSQTEIARMLRITRQAYNHYEMGRREPNNLTIKEIAKYYRVSTDYILCLSDDRFARTSEEIDEYVGSHIKSVFDRLSDQNKRNLLLYAEFLISREYEDRKFSKKITFAEKSED